LTWVFEIQDVTSLQEGEQEEAMVCLKDVGGGGAMGLVWEEEAVRGG
jgi:hypothetical protein